MEHLQTGGIDTVKIILFYDFRRNFVGYSFTCLTYIHTNSIQIQIGDRGDIYTYEFHTNTNRRSPHLKKKKKATEKCSPKSVRLRHKRSKNIQTWSRFIPYILRNFSYYEKCKSHMDRMLWYNIDTRLFEMCF